MLDGGPPRTGQLNSRSLLQAKTHSCRAIEDPADERSFLVE